MAFVVYSYLGGTLCGFHSCFKDRCDAERYVERLKKEENRRREEYIQERIEEFIESLFDFDAERDILDRPIEDVISEAKQIEYGIEICNEKCDKCTAFLMGETSGKEKLK